VLVTGEVLAGRYRIDGFLGCGGAGGVWRGDDLRLLRVVAVKLLSPRPDQSWEAVRAKAATVACLQHPNVVSFYDAGMEGDQAFLVTELIDGPDLAELLDAEPDGRADLALVEEIARQVSAAIDAAHAAGVVHGDIKPGNLLVTLDGTVKLGDFGVVCAVPHPGSPPGMASYLSPEQVRGQTACEASDWYALGCVLYELLAGRPPFVGDSVEEVLDQHLHAAPVPIEVLRPDVETRLAAVLMRLLAKDPSRRLTSLPSVRGR
jgi:eukaryotic-like serine/threonine-protein kinase